MFGVYKVSDDGKEIKLGRTSPSDENGEIEISSLNEGEYILKQYSAPAGYEADGTINEKFTISLDSAPKITSTVKGRKPLQLRK